MILKHCFVENFGILHQYSFTVEEEFTTIYAENGSGKSTFAAFLRAMFYGMPATRTRKNLDEAERKKYKPWQGGLWGGYVCFQVGDRTYRIERTFADKDKGDTFRLLDENTGFISSDYSENVGFELFGVDRDAFCSTVFITQTGINVVSKGNISERLGRISQDNDGIDTSRIESDSYEMACNIVQDEYREYIKTGQRGLVFETQKRINDIENELANLKKRYDEIESNINKSEPVMIDLSDYDLTEDEKKRLSWLDDYFANGIPMDEELQTYENNGANGRRLIGLMTIICEVLACALAGISLWIIGYGWISAAVIVIGIIIAWVLYLRIIIYNKKKKTIINEVAQDLHRVRAYKDEYLYLSEKEKNCNVMKAELSKKMNAINRSTDLEQLEKMGGRISELESERNEAVSELDQYRYRAQVLSDTKTMLEQARNDYASGYIGKVRDNLRKYLAFFNVNLAENVVVNIDLEVSVVADGITRNIDYFSNGTRDIIWLCERFAIIDAIFDGENPCVIMDDPLVNFDDDNMQLAIDMLEEFSKHIQIIYMTCQHGRMN